MSDQTALLQGDVSATTSTVARPLRTNDAIDEERGNYYQYRTRGSPGFADVDGGDGVSYVPLDIYTTARGTTISTAPSSRLDFGDAVPTHSRRRELTLDEREALDGADFIETCASAVGMHAKVTAALASIVLLLGSLFVTAIVSSSSLRTLVIVITKKTTGIILAHTLSHTPYLSLSLYMGAFETLKRDSSHRKT